MTKTQNDTRPMTTQEVIVVYGCEARCLYTLRDENGNWKPAAEWPHVPTSFTLPSKPRRNRLVDIPPQ